MLRMIAAIDNKRGLATNAGIPWNLPIDKAFFHRQVLTGTILMASGTYPDFPMPVGKDTNYVVTRKTEPLRPGFEIVRDVDAFIQEHSNEDVQCVGGGHLYEALLGRADELILTQIEANFDCTIFFPEYAKIFELVSQSNSYTENGTTFRFTTWQRKLATH